MTETEQGDPEHEPEETVMQVVMRHAVTCASGYFAARNMRTPKGSPENVSTYTAGYVAGYAVAKTEANSKYNEAVTRLGWAAIKLGSAVLLVSVFAGWMLGAAYGV